MRTGMAWEQNKLLSVGKLSYRNVSASGRSAAPLAASQSLAPVETAAVELTGTHGRSFEALMLCYVMLLLAAQHVRQVVFTHRLGQRQASVLAAKVVEVRSVKNS
jgi:hypothetical protein